MRVVIVGKTKMRGGICVGGLEEDNALPVRLIPPGEACNPISTPYEIGDVWEVDLMVRSNLQRPHVEDHDVLRGKKIGKKGDLKKWLLKWISPWSGEPKCLFDGTVRFRASGTAFVAESGPLPCNSTGYWILPRAMVYSPFIDNVGKEHPKFAFCVSSTLILPYVGLVNPIEKLPKGTLVRLSLSRAWRAANVVEERERLSVQLSGWHLQ